MSYKCVFCVDEYFLHDDDRPFSERVRDADTIVPFSQAHGSPSLGQPPVVTVVAVPCCLEHRKEQVTAAGGKLFRA